MDFTESIIKFELRSILVCVLQCYANIFYYFCVSVINIFNEQLWCILIQTRNYSTPITNHNQRNTRKIFNTFLKHHENIYEQQAYATLTVTA